MLWCTGVRDTTAILKSLYLVVLSVVMTIFYGSAFAICADIDPDDISGSDFEDYTESHCRLYFFDNMTRRMIGNDKVTNGHVYVIYYVLVWAIMICASVFGFILLFVKCGLVVRRFYAFLLVGAMGLQATGDVVSVITSWNNYDEAIDALGDGNDYTENQYELGRSMYLGLQIVVSMMICFILAVTAFDTWDHSDQDDEEAERAEKKQAEKADGDQFGV